MNRITTIKLLFATLAITAGLTNNTVKPNALAYGKLGALTATSGALSAISGLLAYKIFFGSDCSVRNAWHAVKKARTTLKSPQANEKEKHGAKIELADYGFDLCFGLPMGALLSCASLTFAWLTAENLNELVSKIILNNCA